MPLFLLTLLGLLGTAGSGLLSGLGTLGSGISTGLQGTIGLAGQAIQTPGVAQLLGGLLSNKSDRQQSGPPPIQFPSVFQPTLTGVSPSSSAFFTTPRGARVRVTPALRLADQQSRAISRLQKRFVRSTIEPRLQLIQRAAQTETRAKTRELNQFLRAQESIRKIQSKAAARGRLGRKDERRLARLQAIGRPVIPQFNTQLLTPFSMLGIRAF